MQNANTGATPSGRHALPLFIAWAVVAIPLLWGVEQTWLNVAKLLATPPAATEPAVPAPK